MDSEDQYAQLEQYAEQRAKEMRPMLEPYLEVTDEYGRLLCRLSGHVGKRSPIFVQDAVVRDLMADIFDFLYEGRARGQVLPFASGFEHRGERQDPRFP